MLKKGVKWVWTKEINDDFEQLKKEFTKAPCLAHFDAMSHHQTANARQGNSCRKNARPIY